MGIINKRFRKDVVVLLFYLHSNVGSTVMHGHVGMYGQLI